MTSVDPPVIVCPPFASAMVTAAEALGPVVASGPFVHEGETLAFGVVIDGKEGGLAVAVGRSQPAVVVMRSRAPREAALAVALSVASRSGKKLVEGGLVSSSFEDMGEVSFVHCPPQVALVPAEDFGVRLAGAKMAVGCTWSEMALDPEARLPAATKRAALSNGVTEDALAPLDGALSGLARSLRKAKEPTLTNAAWVAQSLLETHAEKVETMLRALVVEKLTEERADLVGALVDEANEGVLVRENAAAPKDAPRVVVCELRLPKAAKDAAPRPVVVYFYWRGTRRLEERYPEPTIDAASENAGFRLLDAVYDKHAPLLLVALEAEGGVTLQRGFHVAVTREQARASFVEDGFWPIDLVLES